MKLDSKLGVLRESYNTLDPTADLLNDGMKRKKRSKAKIAQLKSLRAKAQQIQDEILKITHGGTKSTDTCLNNQIENRQNITMIKDSLQSMSLIISEVDSISANKTAK